MILPTQPNRVLVDRNELRLEAARRNYGWFVRETMPQLKLSWHHYKMTDLLERIARGEVKKAAIFTPPRHTKTTLCSVGFSAYFMGRLSGEVLVSSYGGDLSNEIGRKTRALIETPRYREIFGKGLSRDSSAVTRFHLDDGLSGFAAISIGGSITGKTGNLLQIDDPIKKMRDARNAVHQAGIRQWFDTEFLLRQTPGVLKEAPIILTQTLWSENDLALQLIAEEIGEWEVLRLPAISESGEALWPEFFPLSKLEKIRKAIGSQSFDALYQQAPTTHEGNKIKRKNLRYYTELPRMFHEVIQSWDLTFDDTEGSDFTVGSVYGRYGSNIYLLHQVREQMDIIGQLRAIALMSDTYKSATRKLVEKKANGAAVLTMLEGKMIGLIPVTPSKSKIDRVDAVLPLYEAGNVLYPDKSIAGFDVDEHVKEILAFPGGKHDDRVDAESQALSHFSLGMDCFSRLEAMTTM